MKKEAAYSSETPNKLIILVGVISQQTVIWTAELYAKLFTNTNKVTA